jgi:hypothetical protein
MERQRVRTNPVTGALEHYYEDLGRKGAHPGHGRPMYAPVTMDPQNDVRGRQTLPYRGGAMQRRLSVPGVPTP